MPLPPAWFSEEQLEKGVWLMLEYGLDSSLMALYITGGRRSAERRVTIGDRAPEPSAPARQVPARQSSARHWKEGQ